MPLTLAVRRRANPSSTLGRILDRASAAALRVAAILATALALLLPQAADAKTVIRVQSVIPLDADEVVLLRDFAKDVFDLTGGEVAFEILAAGAVVGVGDMLDAVDQGLV